MNDAVAVCVTKGPCYFLYQSIRRGVAERSDTPDALAKRFTFDVRHHEKR